MISPPKSKVNHFYRGFTQFSFDAKSRNTDFTVPSKIEICVNISAVILTTKVRCDKFYKYNKSLERK